MNYGFATGAIKATETRLLDKNKLAKLFKVNEEEFRSSLVDMGYGVNATTLEGIVTGELLKVKKFLASITPKNNVMNLFYLQNDAQNIKVIYKAKIFGLPHNDNFVATGVLTKDILMECIVKGNWDKAPDEYAPLLRNIDAKVEGLKNARIISAKIDSCVFDFIFNELETKYHDEALKVYFKAFIDFANIMTLVRCQALKWSYDRFLEMFVEHGSIEKTHFFSGYSLASESLSKHFIRKDYGEKIFTGLKIYSEDMDLSHFEKFLDELMLKVMKDYSLNFSSVGPLVYYYLEKQAEAKNIRMIYSNHDADISDLLSY